MTANRTDPSFTGSASSPGRGVSSRTSVAVSRRAPAGTELSRQAPSVSASAAATLSAAARSSAPHYRGSQPSATK